MSWTTLAVVASGVSGIVLCIGDDGHFAVEPVHEGHCDRTGNAGGRAQGEGATSMASSAGNGAGACIDVSLGLDMMSRAVKHVTPDRLLKTSILKDLSAGYVAATFAKRLGARQAACGAIPRLSQALLAQRTIVLRI